MKIDKSKLAVTAVAALLGFGSVPQANAALILVGQAANTISLGDQLGAVLTTADAVEIGWFTSGSPDSANFSTYNSATQFLTGWNSVVSGTARAYDIDGLALNSIELPNGNTSLNGKQMYLIAGKGSLLAAATELLILTNSNWIVPNNVVTDAAPDSFSFDVSDVGTTALWGTFASAAGVSYLDEFENTVTLDEYRTALVPEPSTGALMMIGAAGLVALRRLRKV